MNKFLSCYIDKVVICFEEVSDFFVLEKIVFIGNLCVFEVVGVDLEGVLEIYGLVLGKLIVFVFGGSRGVCGVNEVVEVILLEWNNWDF